MYNFKKILLSSLMVSAVLINAPAFAAEGDEKVAHALETTISKLEEAISQAKSGADQETLKQTISDAKQAQKEYRFEQTERKRQYAAEHIKNANNANKSGDKAVLISELEAALAGFKEMKPIYDAAHK